MGITEMLLIFCIIMVVFGPKLWPWLTRLFHPFWVRFLGFRRQQKAWQKEQQIQKQIRAAQRAVLIRRLVLSLAVLGVIVYAVVMLILRGYGT